MGRDTWTLVQTCKDGVWTNVKEKIFPYREFDNKVHLECVNGVWSVPKDGISSTRDPNKPETVYYSCSPFENRNVNLLGFLGDEDIRRDSIYWIRPVKEPRGLPPGFSTEDITELFHEHAEVEDFFSVSYITKNDFLSIDYDEPLNGDLTNASGEDRAKTIRQILPPLFFRHLEILKALPDDWRVVVGFSG